MPLVSWSHTHSVVNFGVDEHGLTPETYNILQVKQVDFYISI